MELKEKILKLKFYHNKTTDEIVNEAKVDIYEYENLESGVGTPDNETLMKIANYYGISTVELLDPYTDINDLLYKSHICIVIDRPTQTIINDNNYQYNNMNDTRPPMKSNTNPEGSVVVGILLVVLLGCIGFVIALVMGKPKTTKGAVIGFIINFILNTILISIATALGLEIPGITTK